MSKYIYQIKEGGFAFISEILYPADVILPNPEPHGSYLFLRGQKMCPQMDHKRKEPGAAFFATDCQKQLRGKGRVRRRHNRHRQHDKLAKAHQLIWASIIMRINS